MAKEAVYRRFVERCLTEGPEDSPVTLIHGPRQFGNTALHPDGLHAGAAD